MLVLVNATSWPDIIGAAGTVTAALAAPLALLYARQQIGVARGASRQQLTYSYFARFASPEMIPYVAKWSVFISLGNSAQPDVPWSADDPDGRWEEFEATAYEERLGILLVPNFLEEFAGMYNRELLDREVAREFIGGVSQAWWDIGGWFIERVRERDPTDLVQWKQMRDDMLLKAV